jgi:hypothetical protein
MLSAGRGVDPEELHRITGGNPFYVREVLEAGLGEVPGSARDVVLARAARLDPKARETLEAAALIGGTVDERLLRHVVAGPALAEVISSGLVAGQPVLRFRHEIARQATRPATARRPWSMLRRPVVALARWHPIAKLPGSSNARCVSRTARRPPASRPAGSSSRRSCR